MRNMHGKFRFNFGAIAALAAITILMPSNAQAYVDPSTGGLLVQLVTGGIAGIAVLARLYWRRLRDSLFTRNKPSTPSAPAGPPPDGGDRR